MAAAAVPTRPPTPYDHVNVKGLQALNFEPSQVGYKSWRALVDALLGPPLAQTLDHALRNKRFEPTDPRETNMHEFIGRLLLPSLQHLPDVVVRVTQECGQLGPKIVNLLKITYVRSGLGRHFRGQPRQPVYGAPRL